MTISKKRFEAIVVEVAKDMPPFDLCEEPYAYHKYFAHALIKRVEADSEVVVIDNITEEGKEYAHALPIPLVAEE